VLLNPKFRLLAQIYSKKIKTFFFAPRQLQQEVALLLDAQEKV